MVRTVELGAAAGAPHEEQERREGQPARGGRGSGERHHHFGASRNKPVRGIVEWMGWRRAAQLGRGWPHSSPKGVVGLVLRRAMVGIDRHRIELSPIIPSPRRRSASCPSAHKKDLNWPLCSKSVRRWGCRFAHCAPDTTTRPPPPRSVARSTSPLLCFGRRTSPLSLIYHRGPALDFLFGFVWIPAVAPGVSTPRRTKGQTVARSRAKGALCVCAAAPHILR